MTVVFVRGDVGYSLQAMHAVRIILPRTRTEPLALVPSRLHPGYVILWLTLLAIAGVMLWAVFRDPLPM